jgi:cytochrome c-type biogenesis protein CcmF
MFTYLIVPFVFFMGIGPLSRWKSQSAQALYKQMLIALGLSISAALLINASFSEMSYLAVLGVVLSGWIVVSTVFEIVQRTQPLQHTQQLSLWQSLASLSRSHWGMVSGHLGFAVTLIGISLVSAYSVERNVRMAIGDELELQGYRFVFDRVSQIQGPNYSADRGHIVVWQGAKQVADLEAEKRFYPVQRNSMTEAGIDSGITRDLFVALGEPLENGDWALRIYVKPFVNWIWLGALIMAFGGVLSISDRRYRMAKLASKSQPLPINKNLEEQPS